jgi:hypothetical protein
MLKYPFNHTLLSLVYFLTPEMPIGGRPFVAYLGTLVRRRARKSGSNY